MIVAFRFQDKETKTWQMKTRSPFLLVKKNSQHASVRLAYKFGERMFLGVIPFKLEPTVSYHFFCFWLFFLRIARNWPYSKYFTSTYFWYAGDVLLIHASKTVLPESVNKLNSMEHRIKFTLWNEKQYITIFCCL